MYKASLHRRLPGLLLLGVLAGPLAHAQQAIGGAPVPVVPLVSTLPVPAAEASPAPKAQELSPQHKGALSDLLARARRDDLAMRLTEDLTTEIGARLAGTPAEARARAWAVRRLKALGAHQVSEETFTIDGWERLHEHARVLGSSAQHFVISALGSSPPTPPEGLVGDIVRFDALEGLRAVPDGSLKGRIVFVDDSTPRTQDGSGYGLGVGKRRDCAPLAAQKGALACLIRSVGTHSHRFAHTGQMARTGPAGLVPAAALSPPDADQLTRLVARGPVRMQLEIGVATQANAPSGNVIAQWNGTDLASQIVLVGCHLDSWDMGTGAVDDAIGCGIVTAAARLVASMPGGHRRSIQVVYFGAEERGLLGARAFASANPARLKAIALAAESDFGDGRIWRLRSGVPSTMLPFVKTLHAALVPLGVVAGDNLSKGGPDVSVLHAQGVPVIDLEQDGTAYFDYHHTPDDTFDKVRPQEVSQNVAAWAVFLYLATQLPLEQGPT